MAPNRPQSTSGIRSATILALFFGPTALSQQQPIPPAPNPARPVNYIEWINHTFGAGLQENAFEKYLQSYALLSEFKKEWNKALEGPWSDMPELSEWLTEHDQAIALFSEAAGTGDCFFRLPDKDHATDARLAHALHRADVTKWSKLHRAAIKGLISQGWHDWTDQDYGSLIRSACLAIQSGHHFDANPLVLHRINGIAAAALGYQAIRNAMNLADDRGELANEVLEMLDRVDSPFPPFENALLGERLTAWDLCQRAFVPTKGRTAWGYHQPVLQSLGLNGLPAIEFRGIIPKPITFQLVLEEFNDYFDLWEQWCKTPYPLARGRLDEIEKFKTKNSSMLLKTAGASYERARIMHEKITADKRATRLILQLFDHRREKGAFPTSLDDLRVRNPQNRIDPFSGDPFNYKPGTNDFLLYSLGVNLTDEGGTHGRRWREGDHVYWPPKNSGDTGPPHGKNLHQVPRVK